MKAALYIRTSTGKQDISPEMQEEKLRQYISIHGLTLAGIYTEVKSAKNLNRPVFQSLLTELEKGEIKAICVYKMDRAFRSLRDALEITAAWDKAGIAFCSVMESIDTKSATGKLFFSILNAFNEFERTTISERTTAALQHLKSQNKTCGNLPYGYNRDMTRPEVKTIEGTDIIHYPHLIENHEEQAVLIYIKGAAGKKTLAGIARELNFNGYKTRTGRNFTASHIHNILKKEAKK